MDNVTEPGKVEMRETAEKLQTQIAEGKRKRLFFSDMRDYFNENVATIVFCAHYTHSLLVLSRLILNY